MLDGLKLVGCQADAVSIPDSPSLGQLVVRRPSLEMSPRYMFIKEGQVELPHPVEKDKGTLCWMKITSLLELEVCFCCVCTASSYCVTIYYRNTKFS